MNAKLRQRIFDAYNEVGTRVQPHGATIMDVDEGLVEFLRAVVAAECAAADDPVEMFAWWSEHVIRALLDARPEGVCRSCAADYIRLELEPVEECHRSMEPHHATKSVH